MATAQSLERFPPGSIQTPEQASAALDAAQKEKRSVEAEYRTRQKACYEQFLTTPCLEDEKAWHQQAQVAIKSVELEASRYQRQQKALQTAQRRREAETERSNSGPQDVLKRQQNQQAYLQKQRDLQSKQAAQQQKQEQVVVPQAKTPKAVVDDSATRKKNAEHQREKVREAAERREQTAARRAKNEAARARKKESNQETLQKSLPEAAVPAPPAKP